MADKKKGVHPNSLKNLRSFADPEHANAAREAGLEKRRRNAEEREAMRFAIEAFQGLKVDIPPAVEVLRIAMSKAIRDEDMDEVTRLAALIAPYETPKLASKEVTVNDGLAEKTDAELAQLAKEFGVNLKEIN